MSTTLRYREPRRRTSGRPGLANGLATLILGLVAAVLVAGLSLLWATSPLGSVPILTPIVQGGLLGLILARLVGGLGLRSAGLAVVLGLACGTASLAALHGGHYLKFVLLDVPRLIRQERLPARQTASLLELQRQDPWVFADQLIFARKTGRVGFPGFMALRNDVGEEIAGRALRHWPLWGLWGFEGTLIVLIPAVLAASAASRPPGPVAG